MYSHTMFFLACVGAVFSSSTFAQGLLPASRTLQIKTSSTHRGGRYITASGALNVLFIYVQFPDDNYLPSSSYWPKGQAPRYMNATVDSVWSATPTPGGFTDYFNQMSFNTLKITGKSVSVITPHTRKFYLNKRWASTQIHREVLRQLDRTIDFAQFDHWRCNGKYNFTNSPDSVVDMILMMWRNICNDTADVRSLLNLIPGGESSLGGDYTGCTSFNVDNGARTINMCYGENGSGITAIQPMGGDLDSALLWHYARHEFGHCLIGGNDYHTKLGTWGLLDGWGAPGDCMNSFERERLGWINFNTINFADYTNPTTITNLTLPDYVTTGVAYRLNVPGGGSNDYYLLENHQRISQFDVPDNNDYTAKGIFILQETTDKGDSVGIVSAQGRFNWNVPYQLPNIYGGNGTLPVFQRGSSNRVRGYDKRAYIPWTWQGVAQKPAAMHYYLDPATGVLRQAGVNGQGTIFTGDGKDQFDLNNNPVFTPASNPSSDAYNNTNKIGFEITSINNGIYVVKVFINTVADASPSKPQDIKASSSSPSSVVLSWAANTEPNMTQTGNHGYDVYRSLYYDGATLSYIKINSALLSSPSFTDNPPTPGSIPADKDVYWRYHVKATDNTGKVSVVSEDAWVFVRRTVGH